MEISFRMRQASPMTPKPGRTLAAVVLAAGKGTRMHLDRPKVLAEACGAPLVNWVVERARCVGAAPIVVVVGHRGGEVRDAFASSDGIAWVEQEQPLGTGDALFRAGSVLTGFQGNLLVLYGDVPAVREEALLRLLASHEAQRASATILTSVVADPTGYGRVVRDGAGRFARIVEHADADAGVREIREINVGAYVFDARPALDAAAGLAPRGSKGERYLTEVVDRLSADGGTIASIVLEEPEHGLGVNSLSDLARVRGVLQAEILERHLEAGVRIVDPRTTYVDRTVRIGEGTVIHPCTVIEGIVEIGRDCEIGPFTRLRTGTRLLDGAEVGNFTEMKKSVLGRGSKAKHLSYLGDAVIGDGANIGAGTITANYDGRGKFVTKIADGAFIGSGTILVAPVEVGRRATTGAGAVLLKRTPVGEGEVFVGIPARRLPPSTAAVPAEHASGRGSRNPRRPARTKEGGTR